MEEIISEEKIMKNVDIYGAGRKWTTADECSWLDRIGETAAKSSPRPKFSGTSMPYKTKKQLLQSYVNNAKNRAEWGEINPFIAIQHAKDLIATL